MRENWLKNQKESERLVQAGVDNEVIDSAVASFVLETMAHHGEPSQAGCVELSGIYVCLFSVSEL